MDTQTKNQNCQSDEAPHRYGFDRLPQEIVLDIASRLPIASLLQFTFVRKSFYNLSHDPELVNLHCYYKKLPVSVKPQVHELVFGFGLHPITKEYKMEKCWRYRFDSRSQEVMLNGKMHWLTRFGKYYGHCDMLIVFFDLADEVFGEVPKVDFGVEFQLAVLGYCLPVALTLPHQNGVGLEIWVMKEYNVKVSWMK
ncbi:F-box protein At3g07870-like [Lycium ferocissimum]|uniref:F-box protein At3g07870-like n=1 Tax=Lycium ferocissimum TaxID=112874 RepID=UPI0028149C4D|nr:F-box protein At3g07870-like [Lycium ferocissimum]